MKGSGRKEEALCSPRELSPTSTGVSSLQPGSWAAWGRGFGSGRGLRCLHMGVACVVVGGAYTQQVSRRGFPCGGAWLLRGGRGFLGGVLGTSPPSARAALPSDLRVLQPGVPALPASLAPGHDASGDGSGAPGPLTGPPRARQPVDWPRSHLFPRKALATGPAGSPAPRDGAGCSLLPPRGHRGRALGRGRGHLGRSAPPRPTPASPLLEGTPLWSPLPGPARSSGHPIAGRPARPSMARSRRAVRALGQPGPARHGPAPARPRRRLIAEGRSGPAGSLEAQRPDQQAACRGPAPPTSGPPARAA